MGGGGAGGPDGGGVGVRASRCALRDLEPTDRTPGIEPAVLGIEPSGSNLGLELAARARGCHGTWRMLGRPAVASPTGVGSYLIV